MTRALRPDAGPRGAMPARATRGIRPRFPPSTAGAASRAPGGPAPGRLGLGLCALLAACLADTIAADPAPAGRGASDAAEQVACSQGRGQATTSCDAAVSRDAAGATTIVVTFPNGFARTLSFEDGAFTRGNPTMSGTGRDTDWRIERGVHRIRVDDQVYEIPDDLLRVGGGGSRP